MKTIDYRFRDVAEAYPELPTSFQKITSPQDMFNMFKLMFLNLVQEVFIVYWLNSANKVIGFDTISQGNLNSSIVHPREVFRGAVVSSCASIILAHNHPSGNPEPSAEDISITKKIHEAGKLLDIPVFDHIIFAGDSYTSFVEKRLI
ncbi:MAG: JAB domain-containing protein [Ignavibacteriaceae bacterium]|nr:JAB domain-containing protein [Ignavibacteriaceae bacterium]